MCCRGRLRKRTSPPTSPQVVTGGGTAEYVDPVRFFANTYPTRGLKNLLANVCRRLSGAGGEAAAIFRLDTSYGGGKTHGLIALAHAARGLAGVAGVEEFIDPALLPQRSVRLAAFDGENADPANGRTMGEGIRAHTPWGELAWVLSQRRPVLRLDFSGGNFRRAGAVEESATAQIDDIGRRAGVESRGGSAPVRFRRLIEALSERAGCRAVVLVDEYDKPILDVLDDPEQAKANRDDLRGLYGTLKASDAHVELTFITGVRTVIDTTLPSFATRRPTTPAFMGAKRRQHYFRQCPKHRIRTHH